MAAARATTAASQPGYALGIDLGTTYTVCYLVHRETNRVIAVDLDGPGQPLLRSAVAPFAGASEGLLVGSAAVAQEAGCIVESKRLIGRSMADDATATAAILASARVGAPRVVRGAEAPGGLPSACASDAPLYVFPPELAAAPVTPTDVAGAILSQVVTAAAAAVGRDMGKTCVGAPAQVLRENVAATRLTVPAYFGDGPRRATLAAAAAAGLPAVRLVNEPTAAAVAYGASVRRTERAPGNMLVVDLGGGTFDVTALAVDARGAVRVAASQGVAHMGGMDVTEALCATVEERSGIAGVAGVQAVRAAVERCKLALSFDDAPQEVPLPSGACLALTREDVDKAAEPTITRAVAVTHAVALAGAAAAGLPSAQAAVSDVLCVGGATRMPALRASLQRAWPRAVLRVEDNPDTLVALGAGLLAVGGALLRDVAPLTIGVKSATGAMQPLLPRGTPLGKAVSVQLPTTRDYQRAQVLQVYEGEHILAEENALLGIVRVEGIERAACGTVASTVTTSMDASGVVAISATAPAARAEQTVHVEAQLQRPVAPEHGAALIAAHLRSVHSPAHAALQIAAQAAHALEHAALTALADARALVGARAGAIATVNDAARAALRWLNEGGVQKGAAEAHAQLDQLLATVRPVLQTHLQDVQDAQASEEASAAETARGFMLHDAYLEKLRSAGSRVYLTRAEMQEADDKAASAKEVAVGT